MERRTFLTSTGAGLLGSVAGAGSLLSAFTQNATAASVIKIARNRFVIQSEDLSPYAGAWGDIQIHHLLRRAMFGVPESQFTAAQALGSMDAVVTQLLDNADVTKNPLPSLVSSTVTWPNTIPKGNPNLLQMENQEIVNWCFDRMMQENLSIRQKMTLMWTNHFVTGSSTVNVSAWMYYYLIMCMQYAVGNFKDFATAMSTSSAMLNYLNGDQNYVTSKTSNVNENFARELMELFTLGITFPFPIVNGVPQGNPNYTQTDIENSGRALTGWVEGTTAPFAGQFIASRHDATSKTFLSDTGNWALDDIINIIFSQPTSESVSALGLPSGYPEGYTSAFWASNKIYKTFVYYNPAVTDPNGIIRDAMARLMLNPPNPYKAFDLAPVMQALLTSAHFYNPAVIGAQIKSPCEYMGSLVREFGLTYTPFVPDDPSPTGQNDGNGTPTYNDTNPELTYITNRIMNNGLGQQLLNPPNVAGWPGGENWLSAGSFQNRQNYSNAILNKKSQLTFSEDTYAGQIANAGTLEESVLFGDLEEVSLAVPLGPIESTGTYGLAKNPTKTDDVIGTDVPTFAVALSQLPEFQLL
ncbi:MAG TPA: DUF1800 family protein [Candidatus Kapabacteria bacterium]|jgi:uncharacterized protein (DUF1800 family)